MTTLRTSKAQVKRMSKGQRMRYNVTLAYLNLVNSIINGIAIAIWSVLLIAVFVMGILFLAIYSGMLTTHTVSYITGDTWQVFYLNMHEVSSYQITGNWIQQIVQSVQTLFS